MEQELHMTFNGEKDCTHPSLLHERLWSETERASFCLMTVRRRGSAFSLEKKSSALASVLSLPTA